MSVKSSYAQTTILERKKVHPFSLQSLHCRDFIAVTNKILSGEFGLLTLRGTRKTAQA